MTTTATEPIIEVLPAGERLVTEPGRRAATGWTAHFDVVCANCGPIAYNLLYPSACRERNDHLCRPRRTRA